MGVIYKGAKTRLSRASGIDRRFISAQIGFHGQLEGTDALRGDWHPIFTAFTEPLLMLFLTGKNLASGRRTCRRQTDDKSSTKYVIPGKGWSCITYFSYQQIL